MKLELDTNRLKKAVKLMDKANKSKMFPYVRLQNKEVCTLGTSERFKSVSLVISEKNNVEEFEVYLNRDTFIGLVKKAKDGLITIDVTENNVWFIDGKRKAKLPVLKEAVKFLESKDDGLQAEVDTNEYLQALNKVAYVTEFGGDTPAYSGILFDYVDHNKVFFVGTNGLRLAFASAESKSDNNFSFIVPIECLEVMKFVMKEYDDEEAVIWFGDGRVTYKQGEIMFTTMLYDVEFPNYQSVFEKLEEPVCKFESDRTEMIRTLEFLKVLSEDSVEGESAIKIQVDANKLNMNQKNDNGISDNVLEVNGDGEFKPGNIGFYSSNLLDTIVRADADKQVYTFYGEDKPLVVTETESDTDWRALMMPVKMRGI